jgi:diguanylate cyclase (GGDEF)-like protein
MNTISSDIVCEWQSIVDIIAKILEIPSVLIMKINDTKTEIEVLLSSNSEGNPYIVGKKESLTNSGLYSASVIEKKKMLLVPNALGDPTWSDNSSIRLNMISYIGFPISYPDGKVFGTICALDNKTRNFSSDNLSLVEKFRNYIQTSLKLVWQTEKFKTLAYIDFLTNIDNRRSVVEKCEIEMNRSLRKNTNYSLLLIDIDNFKFINDEYGHAAGDLVLKKFVDIVKKKLRRYDIFGRYGGDEFIVLIADTKLAEIEPIGKRICKKCEDAELLYDGNVINFTVSIGVRYVDVEENTMNFDKMMCDADKALYGAKRNGKNQIFFIKNKSDEPLNMYDESSLLCD